MNLKKITLIIFIFTTTLSYSQIDNLTMFINGVMVEVKPPNVDKALSEDWDALQKTAHIKYLTPNFEESYIDNDQQNKYELRYNIYNDEMEFVQNNQTYYTYKKENQIINFFKINRSFIILKNEDKLGYFEILAKGNYSIYRKPKVDFIEGKMPKNNFELKTESRFIKQKDKIFISINNTNLIKLPNNKNAFLNLFGDKKEKVKSYMKSKKLNRKNTEDLILLFLHLNS
ncbi:hypothetical protein [Polaribacter sargassicola]|uniref:hypothetical protein n=1 Tax=Polaribacter sargassicola TaxID=2836891 RepID=UPI001F396B61|nr:hypothetical protein [Polaribacter sp. DS7-9]MCG1034945.1 hypothetical protein [Polaribacter sp. DS7-9]